MIRFPAEAIHLYFPLLHNVQTRSQAQIATYSMDTRGVFQGVNRPGLKLTTSYILCQGQELVELYLHYPHAFMTCKGELNLHLFITTVCPDSVVGMATRYELVRDSNSGGAQIFRNLPGRPWDSPSLLHTTGSKAAGTWCQPPTPSRTKVKERVELYLYSTSWSS